MEIEFKNVSYVYNYKTPLRKTALKNINTIISENKINALVGKCGSGKTTLIKIISGILPSKNTVTIGYSYVDNNRIQDHTKELGIVFGDNINTFLFEDVYKEMAFPLENLNMAPAEIEKRILERYLKNRS